MPLNRLLSWGRAKGIAMALEHGYPMKPFSMQYCSDPEPSTETLGAISFPWNGAIRFVAFTIQLGKF